MEGPPESQHDQHHLTTAAPAVRPSFISLSQPLSHYLLVSSHLDITKPFSNAQLLVSETFHTQQPLPSHRHLATCAGPAPRPSGDGRRRSAQARPLPFSELWGYPRLAPRGLVKAATARRLQRSHATTACLGCCVGSGLRPIRVWRGWRYELVEQFNKHGVHDHGDGRRWRPRCIELARAVLAFAGWVFWRRRAETPTPVGEVASTFPLAADAASRFVTHIV